jgi:tetratricopeptide (TPR) repeat protein
MAGRPVERRASAFAVLAAAGAALLAFTVLLLPWLGERWAGEALTALADGHDAHAITLARRARSVDPLLVDPLWTEALATDDPNRAFALYEQAVRDQPANPQAYLEAGLFALSIGCPRHAYPYLLQFVERDNNARPSEGGDAYREATRLVDSGKPTC